MDRKERVAAFLEAAAKGHATHAAGDLFADSAIHHNPFFAAGMPALLAAMDENAQRHPGKTLQVQRILEEGVLVAVHSRVDGRGGSTAVVHIFRFEGEHVVEMWDVGQVMPPDAANRDGMF